jgi:L,D-peptidoglycan transpeptidase YkuD (ErfK/YbiS/YcfS/YnhG family)
MIWPDLTRAAVGMAIILSALVMPGLVPQAAAADNELRRATEALLSGRMDYTSNIAGDALRSEPKSRLAHWLRAQSLIALAGKPVQLSEEDRDLLDEARVRLEVAPLGMLPMNLVVMPKSAERQVPVLLADASRSRIYVFVSRNGRPVLQDEFYTTIGLLGADKSREGDQKTPLGVYRLQYEIRDPRKDGFLGKMAMTLDYPNAYDSHSGRTGSGIWIHGVPDTLHVRPPQASDGCLAISNQDLARLRKLIRYNETQVVVVPRVEWITPEAWLQNSAAALRDFGASAPPTRMGGVFFIDEKWPWVVTLLNGNQVQRREYFRRTNSGPRRLLGEDLS